MERLEHLFELRVPGLPVVETPLVTGSTGQAHLPEQLTSFVSRSGELAAVDELLTNSRAVTLTGVGGTGKTRLAIEVARRSSERFADGVWMSELVSVRDERLILGQIADIWGLLAAFLLGVLGGAEFINIEGAAEPDNWLHLIWGSASIWFGTKAATR